MKAWFMSLSKTTRQMILLGTLVPLVAIAGFGWAEGWFGGWFAKEQPAASAPAKAAEAQTEGQTIEIGPMPTRAQALQLQPDDRVLGQFGAPLTIIEYASMTCGHCATFKKETFPQVKKNWVETGKAVFVLRDLPWDNLALGMSAVARCVPPEQFYPMTSALFAAQKKIVTGNPLEEIKAVGALSGMAPEQVEACIGNMELQRGIQRSKAIAREVLGVKGTPTFFVNGELIDGAKDYATFNAALEKAYAAATKPAAQ